MFIVGALKELADVFDGVDMRSTSTIAAAWRTPSRHCASARARGLMSLTTMLTSQSIISRGLAGHHEMETKVEVRARRHWRPLVLRIR